jgi:phage-related baseplate assembly protein
VLHVADNPFSVELFLLSDDAHDQERFARRRSARVFDRDVFVPTAEDVVITKLRWSHAGQRTKDLDDVRNVVAVQGDRIDWDYVTSWCDRHGTRELLESVRVLPPGD